MKHYITPDFSIVTVDHADIVTLSIGQNTFCLDFGTDFFSGVGSGESGSINFADWNNDFM